MRLVVGLTLALSLLLGCGAAYPEIAAVHEFPSREELAAIRAPVVPATEALAISDAEDVALVEPPELGVGNAAVDDGPVAAAIAASQAARVASTAGMSCAANALAEFFLREQARPTDPVLEFILGRCGVTAVEPRLALRAQSVAAPLGDEAIAEGHAELFAQLRPTLGGREIPFAMEIGSAFVSTETAAVWLVVAAPRRATLSVTRLEGGRFLILGRVETERMRALEAWVNIGDYGVTPCEAEPGVDLPDVRFTCDMNPHDATARVDLVAIPRQQLLARRIATMLLHRDDEPSLTYRAPPDLGGSAATSDVVSDLAAAFAMARDEAGREPVALSAPESSRHAPLLPKLLAARAAGDAPMMERLMLGLMAGWDTEAPLVGGEVYLGEGSARDARRFMRDHLTTPAARRVLLSPEADLAAITARETDDGIRAALTLYRTFDEAKLPSIRSAWAEHLSQARRRAGVTPLTFLDDVQDLQQEADKVTRGEVHPREALDDAMARLRGRLGRTVRGYYIDAYDPRWVELPVEFQDSGDVQAVTGVAWHHPAGAAWGQLVLYLCVFPE